MESVATRVRVAGDAIRVLSSLSEKLGQPKAQVIELALKQLEERIFWQEVREAFDRAAEDPREAPKQKEEAEPWEGATERDFKGEAW
jgi:hypothetical protein